MGDELTVTILGCGSSGGVPRIGNDWGVCDPGNPRNRRTRCAILVERHSAAGKTTVLIDTGPDLREQMLANNVARVDAVLFTHAHADHIHGIDDLRQFAILQRERIPVFMGSVTYERAYRAFDYCFKTPPGSNYPPILECRSLTAGETATIVGAGGPITFLPTEVEHGEVSAYGFRFHDIAYLPDVSAIPESGRSAFSGLKLWIIDCLRPDPHPSHFHLETTLEWVHRMRPAQALLTNMHNTLDYDKLDRETAHWIHPAHDGLTLRFPIHN